MTSKILAYFFLLVPLSIALAADGPRVSRMQLLSQKLGPVENQLNASDQQALDYYLGGIESLLGRYQAPLQLVCLSNGQSGPYERFTITDPTTGATLGGPTMLATCRQLLAIQNQGLLCVSNGQSGPFERFIPHDLARKQALGGFTGLANCQRLVGTARAALACLSNGQSGPFERFYVYNRAAERQLGGATMLDQCVSTLGD